MTVTILIAATTAAILAILALWALARRERDPRLARIREARALRYRHFEEAREIGRETASQKQARNVRTVRRPGGPPLAIVVDSDDELTLGIPWLTGPPVSPVLFPGQWAEVGEEDTKTTPLYRPSPRPHFAGRCRPARRPGGGRVPS